MLVELRLCEFSSNTTEKRSYSIVEGRDGDHPARQRETLGEVLGEDPRVEGVLVDERHVADSDLEARNREAVVWNAWWLENNQSLYLEDAKLPNDGEHALSSCVMVQRPNVVGGGGGSAGVLIIANLASSTYHYTSLRNLSSFG